MSDELEKLSNYSRKHVQRNIDTEELKFLLTSDFYNYFSDRTRKKIDSVLAETARKDLSQL